MVVVGRWMNYYANGAIDIEAVAAHDHFESADLTLISWRADRETAVRIRKAISHARVLEATPKMEETGYLDV